MGERKRRTKEREKGGVRLRKRERKGGREKIVRKIKREREPSKQERERSKRITHTERIGDNRPVRLNDRKIKE